MLQSGIQHFLYPVQLGPPNILGILEPTVDVQHQQSEHRGIAKERYAYS
jgi:hypothetical protein